MASQMVSESEQLKQDLARLTRLQEEIALHDAENLTDFVDEPSIFDEQPEPVDTSAGPANSRVENVRHCLDLNLANQERIRNYISVVQALRAQISEQIRFGREEMEREKQLRQEADIRRPFPVCVRTVPFTLLSFRRPYFKHVFGLFPPANVDTKNKSERGETLPGDEYYESGWDWGDEKTEDRLIQEVRREFLANHLKPHIRRRNQLRDIVSQIDGPGLAKATRELEEAEEKIRRTVHEVDREELFRDKQLLAEVDWLKVAKKVGGTPSHMTCRLVWTNYLSPVVNKKKFAHQEDRRLKNLGKKFARKRWSKVAERMDNGRTAFQCLQRYQSKIVPLMTGTSDDQSLSTWHREDNERLMEIASSMNMNSQETELILQNIDWQMVAQKMEYFSARQCLERYAYLTSVINKGIWLDDEIARLKEAVDTFGPSNWVGVSSYVGTRTTNQCSAQYHTLKEKEKAQQLLGQRGPLDWTSEEDSIVWFNRNSPHEQLRQISEIVKLLPHRSELEIKNRYKMLKVWYRHAEYMLKNRGTLLSLVCKTDADLTFVEMEKLKDEFLRFKAGRRLEPSHAAVLPVSFAERGQLERWTSAMVMEAGLSRELVRDKVKMIQDIYAMKMTPVPLMRNMPTGAGALERKEEAHRKIKELLLRAMAERRRKEEELNARRRRVGKRLSATRGGINLVMAKLQYALQDARYVDRARDLLSQLESIKGNEGVVQLIEISRNIDRLVRQINLVKTNQPQQKNPAPKPFWIDTLMRLRLIYRPYSLVYSPPSHRRYYPSSLKGRPVPKAGDFSDPVAKMLVISLGTNFEAVKAEAEQQRDIELTEMGQKLDEVDKEIIGEFGNYFPVAKATNTAAALRHFRAAISLRALESSVDDPNTASGGFASLRDEFNQGINIDKDDFAENDIAPSLPPNPVTSCAYRTLLLARLRLQDIVVQQCTSAEREGLVEAVESLKRKPTEGYALLRHRFEALFTWPSVVDEAMPQDWSEELRAPSGFAPLTPFDVPDTDEEPDYIPDISRPPVPLKDRAPHRKLWREKLMKENPFQVLGYWRKRQRHVLKDKKRPWNATNPNRLPPTHRDARSTRIKKLIEQGRIDTDRLGGLSKRALVRRAAKLAIIRQRKIEEEIQGSGKREGAVEQLETLVPVVRVVPLEEPLPPTTSRIPKVSTPPKPTVPAEPISRRSFAEELAERAVLRHYSTTEEVDFSSRDNSFPATAPLPQRPGRQTNLERLARLSYKRPEKMPREPAKRPALVEQVVPAQEKQPLKRVAESSQILSPEVTKRSRLDAAQTPVSQQQQPQMQTPVAVASTDQNTQGQVAVVELRYEDILKMFEGGARSAISLAVVIPGNQPESKHAPSST